MINRRNALKILGLSTLASGVYSAQRGVRLPPFRWEPDPPSSEFVDGAATVRMADVIRSNTQLSANSDWSFRAYSPAPELFIDCSERQTKTFEINNIAVDAQLDLNGIEASNLSESKSGISRLIEIRTEGKSQVHLRWQTPRKPNFRFAAIGDTGGGSELSWCIKRAHLLGAEFLLHLGDFNYQASDYQSAIQAFYQAPLPCYVAIGNHDHHDNGPIYQRFLQNIGPFNNSFAIGKVRFINLDTAANILPYNRGQRGELLREISKHNEQYQTSIAFSHRPLYDPDSDRNHDIGSIGERDWLIKSLKAADVSSLLSGHIHIADRRDIAGIDNIIVGQGLGHQDLITHSDYSKIAIGTVDEESNVEITLEPLSMPMELHCHPRVDPVKQSMSTSLHRKKMAAINEQCKKTNPQK